MTFIFNHKYCFHLPAGRGIKQKLFFVITFLSLVCTASGRQVKRDSVTYKLYFKDKADSNLVEAIGYVKGEQLRGTPLASINFALTGRIAGLMVTQNNGEPGNYGTSLTLRSRAPLVLVDGIPRDLSSVLPEHVESVTVLKDAVATAPLGLRGANGVVLITTRKRAEKNGFNLDFTANTGMSESLKMRDQLPAWQYAELYNEALANEGRAPKYSAADIEAYKNGTSSYLYPNNNWKDLIMKNSAPYQRYVLNAEGKSDLVSYFLSGDYMNQEGILKQADYNSYSTNVDYSRFGLRGNVEIAIAPKTSLALNLYGSSQKKNMPGGGPTYSFAPNTNRLTFTNTSVESLFNSIITTPANAYPVYNPNATLGGSQLYSNNIWGQLTGSGYSQSNINEGMFDLVLKRDLNDLWKGWWAQGTLSYTMTVINTLVRSKAFATYEMKVGAAADTTYRQFGSIGDQQNASNTSISNGSLFFDLSTGLKRNWNGQQLDVTLQYQYSSSRFGSQLPFNIQNAIARAEYGIGGKYIFDAAVSYSGNNWYKSGHQYEVYPAAGFAWNVHNEGFFNRDGLINSLKLRTTYGLTGNINANYYAYMYTYSNYGNAYYFGSTPGAVDGVEENQIPYVRTTEKTLKLDVGLDAGLFNNRATISADYYRDKAYDLLQTRGNNTALLGAPYPDENLGKIRYTGMEVSAGWNNRGKAWNYFLTGNVAFVNSKILDNDEQPQAYPWMGTEGNRVNQFYGYIADGFVTAAGEGPVVEGYRSVPGDLKYKDLNGDGVINFYDQTKIGPDKPAVFYGLNAGLAVKGFDLSVLFSGVANRTVNLTGTGEWEFQNNGQAAAFTSNLGRWTPETAETATYPRLTLGTNPNNHVNSTFWLHSADFLRLKSAEIGYSFSSAALSKIKISKVRLFVSGFNLLTFSGDDGYDPETLSYGYPLQRFYNAGLSVKF